MLASNVYSAYNTSSDANFAYGAGNGSGSGSCDPNDGHGSEKPEPQGGENGNSGDPQVVPSNDPNDKFGAAGFGVQAFIAADAAIPYHIDFENLGPGSTPVPQKPATAPAQRVEITDQLPPTLDWSTLRFTEAGFGDHVISVPADSTYYFTTVAMTYNGQTFDVEVELSYDTGAGKVRAVFQSVDPATFLPPDVLTGFLPPEDGTGRGKGYIGFAVAPLENLPSGTEIRNVALISFDLQTIIATNQVDPQDPTAGTDPNREALNTIDAGRPSSVVAPLPATSFASFPVSWTGADEAEGSGVASFDVFVAIDGAPFTLWLDDTPEFSADFLGTAGHTYAFYSVATDHVGHVEAFPATHDAATRVVAPSYTLSADFDANGVVDGADFLKWQRGLGASGPQVTRADGDANEDKVVDGVDLDAWKAAAGSLPPAWADFDSDQDIDGTDFLLWQRGLGSIRTSAAPALGDADHDLKVDGEDLGPWESMFGAMPPWADFDADADIDGTGFLVWQRGLGSKGAAVERGQGDANGDLEVNDGDLGIWKATYGRAVPAGQLARVVALMGQSSTLEPEIALDLAMETNLNWLASQFANDARWENRNESAIATNTIRDANPHYRSRMQLHDVRPASNAPLSDGPDERVVPSRRYRVRLRDFDRALAEFGHGLPSSLMKFQ
jgi:hypothetical protein